MSQAERPHVLAIAFECLPGAGSEAGAAWGVVQALAAGADLTVVVGSHHLPAIHRHLDEHPDERLAFVGAPTTEGRLLARLIRLHRQFDFVAYLLWLRGARRKGRELQRHRPFDAAIHVSYGSYWLPSPVVDFEVPSVWGPVGGATITPWRLTPLLGWKGLLGELEGRFVIRLGSLLPSTRRTWRSATVRLSETYQTRDALPAGLRATTPVINRAILSRVPDLPVRCRENYLLFPSSLQGRKGPRLAIRALAHTPQSVKLRFVSSGYEEASLRRLAAKLGVADRVEFHGHIPRARMFEMLGETAGVVFAGLREEGGCALSEAMLVGAPVIVLAHAGPRVIAELNTDPDRVALIEPSTPSATARSMGEAMTRFSESPSDRHDSYLDQASVAASLNHAVAEAIERGRATEPV